MKKLVPVAALFVGVLVFVLGVLWLTEDIAIALPVMGAGGLLAIYGLMKL